MLAGRDSPSIPRDLGDPPRRLAIHRDHQIVEGWIRLAVRDASRIVRAVVRGVPAPRREVEPAHEREPVVDDDDLLVVRARERVAAVEPEVHPPMALPAEAVQRRELAVGAEDHRIVPVEHVDAQLAAPPCEVVQELAERRAGAAVVAEGEGGTAVEVPREDDDRALGQLGRGHEAGEVVGAVDEKRHAVRVRDGAAVLLRAEETPGNARIGHVASLSGTGKRGGNATCSSSRVRTSSCNAGAPNRGRSPLRTLNVYVPPGYSTTGDPLPRGRK